MILLFDVVAGHAEPTCSSEDWPRPLWHGKGTRAVLFILVL